jgi:hypothetical protein
MVMLNVNEFDKYKIKHQLFDFNEKGTDYLYILKENIKDKDALKIFKGLEKFVQIDMAKAEKDVKDAMKYWRIPLD